MDEDSETEKGNSFAKFTKFLGLRGVEKTQKIGFTDLLDNVNLEEILNQKQIKMIKNVAKFNSLTAADIMTHRVDIVAVSNSSCVNDVVKKSIESGFSRIIVYNEEIDNIVGFVNVKDLLHLILEDESKNSEVLSYVREVIFVPESMRCLELFNQLTKNKIHIAAVIDKFGGTAGIVTMEDVAETVLGEIQDEYDDEVDPIIKINDSTYIMQGLTNIEEVQEKLNIEVPADSNYKTLSGFLVEVLGKVPEKGEHPKVNYKNFEFTVLSVVKQHIEKVKAVRI